QQSPSLITQGRALYLPT
ncbi:DSBA-like thioredoxin domain protein, partial [Vibrio parahaemolyticus EKP-021]